MKKIRSRKARAAIYAGIAVLSFAVLFFLLRGPYLSNFTKRLIIPTLENATRERIIMDKAVINLLPFYIQAKGVKVFDKDGNRLLWITKTRAYIDLTGLFVKEVRIRKFTMIEPRLTINRDELESVTQNVREYISRKKGKFKVALMNVDVTDGDLALDDVEGQKSLSGTGLFFHVRVKDTITAGLLIKEAMLKLPNTAAIKGSLEAKLEKENNRIKINELNVRSAESNLKAEGEILLTPEGRLGQGSFKTAAEIYASTFNEMFGLKQDKEGVLAFDGTVSLAPAGDLEWPGISVDLNTKSRFYLETLMEILKVRQDIAGEVSVDGRITGTFPEITGSGKAVLRNAVFDRLPIDNAVGDIAYENKKFTLNDLTAQAYGGKLEGYAHILMPGGDFSVTAEASDVSSPELFSFIHWDVPFPPGKISGNFQLDHKHGQKIAVSADLDYQNVSPREGNILNRLETMSTALELREGILTLREAVMSSLRSDLYLDGNIDFNTRVADLDLRLESSDIADLTAPYYKGLSSPAKFAGKMDGPLKDPGITGEIEAGPGSVEGIMFTSARSALKYRIGSLTVDSLRVLHGRSEYDASGVIEFRKAEGLFSFKGPFYRAKASVKDAQLRPFIKAAYKDIPVSGLASGLLSFEGGPEEFTGTGDLTVKEVDAYGQKADRVEVRTTLHPKSIEFQYVNAYRGNSHLDAKGTIFFNGKYNVTASSGKLHTGDIDVTRAYPLSADITMDMKGSGTFAEPDLEFSVNILESYMKNAKMGTGWVRGRYQGKKLVAEAELINGQIAVDAAADLSDKMQWNADVEIREGRYDFLLAGLLAE
ncbi:MAG: AsmA-like C-terminal region-containing protein, partial [Nitrospirota bacterium]|nr:AsmA-like C-terminal region-containing protein [Nitrospirota bacterium]